MKMIRRLLLPAVTLAVLFCQSAFGVGLGKLELNSALNQEFSAEIELTNTTDLAVEELVPNLASQEDFDRVGVERHYGLIDLRFKVVEKENGTKVVRITSRRVIVEPFLNFIVEILWPNGRMLREYTVLLDPPVFGQQGVAPITPGVTAPRQSDRRAPASRARVPAAGTRKETGDQLITSTHVRGKQEGDIADGEYGMTGAGDTLWKIAMKVRPEKSISVQQTMLALKRLNPEAFINDNINLLKAGYILKIPSRGEILRDSVSEAVAEVRIQNQAFQDYKGNRVSQLDATRRSSRSGSSGNRGDDGELKLLASDGSSGQRAGDSDARSEALENNLAVAREDLDRARRKNAELSVRMKDLSEQIETMNGLLKLQDDQLAALRAQVQKSLEAAPEATPETAAVTTAVTTARQESTAQLGSLLSNPFVLGGLALLLVGGLVGGMIFMRRRQEASAFDNDDFAEVVLGDTQPEVFDAEENEEPLEELLEEEEEEELSPQTGDVISEVEIYIAYGRFPQATKFLVNAIENEPDRADIQLKLLEVYVQTDDATAFNQQFEQLKLLGDSESTALAEELQSKIPGAAEAAVDQVTTDSFDAGEADDDLSFDLDDLDSETDDDSLDLELDLDADLDDDGLDLDDDSIELDLDDTSLDLDLEDDGIELDLDGDSLDLDLEDDSIELDLEDDSIELDLEDDSPAVDLEDDSLDIDLDDDSFELDLEDDGLELDLGDLDDLDLEEDASTKLDLARAYLDMGDNDGVRSLLEEVISEGSEADIKEANELMEKLD